MRNWFAPGWSVIVPTELARHRQIYRASNNGRDLPRHVAGSGPSTLKTLTPNSADADDHAFSSFGGDRLAVDQVLGDVDEVTLAGLILFGAQARTRRSSLRG
jgi:hypothetical protein